MALPAFPNKGLVLVIFTVAIYTAIEGSTYAITIAALYSTLLRSRTTTMNAVALATSTVGSIAHCREAVKAYTLAAGNYDISLLGICLCAVIDIVLAVSNVSAIFFATS